MTPPPRQAGGLIPASPSKGQDHEPPKGGAAQSIFSTISEVVGEGFISSHWYLTGGDPAPMLHDGLLAVIGTSMLAHMRLCPKLLMLLSHTVKPFGVPPRLYLGGGLPIRLLTSYFEKFVMNLGGSIG